MKTATMTAARMNLPMYARDVLRYNAHPQDRTMAFHKFYGAPIHGGEVTPQFEHMDDERVAFRASFILSECLELLRDGLGIQVAHFDMVCGNGQTLRCYNRDDQDICGAIHAALMNGGKRDIVEVVDALGDLNVVVNGFAIELGVDMKRVDQEVCASNFTKAGEDGKPIIGDGTNGPKGKVMKGPNFVPPQIAATIGLGD